MGLSSLISLKSRLLSGLSLPIHINLQDNILAFFFFCKCRTLFFLKSLKLFETDIINISNHQLLCSAILFIFYSLFFLWNFLFVLYVYMRACICVYVCVCMNASVWVSDKVRDTVSSATGVKCCYEPPNVKAGTWT